MPVIMETIAGILLDFQCVYFSKLNEILYRESGTVVNCNDNKKSSSKIFSNSQFFAEFGHFGSFRDE